VAAEGKLQLEIPDSVLEAGLGLTTTKTDFKYDEIVREIIPLEKSDLQALEVLGPKRSQSKLQNLKAYHHNIALRLAAGEKAVHICKELSLSPQTITRLQKSAQFQELIESYRSRLVSKTEDAFELMGLVSTESLVALYERLVGDERAEIPLELLRRISETFVDRTGHSPIRRSETLSRHQHELSREMLERVKELHGEDTAYPVKELSASSVTVHKIESESAGAAASINGAFKPTPKAEGNGKPRSGNGVSKKGYKISPKGAIIPEEDEAV